MRFVFCLRESLDPDLYGLCCKIGEKNFKIILKNALRVLIDPEYDDSSTQNALKKTTNIFSENPPKVIKTTITITSQNDIPLDELLENVSPLKRHLFLKIVLRQYLGLKPLAEFLFIEPDYVDTLNSSEKSASVKKPIARKPRTVSKPRLASKEKEEMPTIEPKPVSESAPKQKEAEIVPEEEKSKPEPAPIIEPERTEKPTISVQVSNSPIAYAPEPPQEISSSDGPPLFSSDEEEKDEEVPDDIALQLLGNINPF